MQTLRDTFIDFIHIAYVESIYNNENLCEVLKLYFTFLYMCPPGPNSVYMTADLLIWHVPPGWALRLTNQNQPCGTDDLGRSLVTPKWRRGYWWELLDKYISFFSHQNCVINEGFSSRNTTETFMCAAYMNIETLIVINKCLRCTKIPLFRHLKTMFAPTTHKTVKIQLNSPPAKAPCCFLKQLLF